MRTHSQSRSHLSQRGGSVTAVRGRTALAPSRLALEWEAVSAAGSLSFRCIWFCLGWVMSRKTPCNIYTEYTWWDVEPDAIKQQWNTALKPGRNVGGNRITQIQTDRYIFLSGRLFLAQHMNILIKSWYFSITSNMSWKSYQTTKRWHTVKSFLQKRHHITLNC